MTRQAFLVTLICQVALGLGLDQCVVEQQLEPHTTWQPPGLDSRRLEQEIVSRLDREFCDRVMSLDLDKARKKTLSVGSILNWICEDDVELVLGDPEELLRRAVQRFQSNDVKGLKLKSFKLINDKSLADCIEALIGCFILESGQSGIYPQQRQR